MQQNPDGCCGVSTDCCPDSKIPDALTMTIVTPCGSYEYPMTLEEWEGGVSWVASTDPVCDFTPPADCISVHIDFRLVCVSESMWMLMDESQNGFAEGSCNPLSLTFTQPGVGCIDLETITITE